ncbi:TRAP transporter small permease [Moraxella sp. Tifton1]|uniref:TRAP transporter small permease protein n=1 Tax=Moraxella oculi TaxID=2940516 RepID=A0ABW8U6F9_9GAMM|nr:TRAP transporter small permease [Moraxella sp. Tifton1]MCL1623736.1 TRAP transporter small permease [Moraxella sp. Tifton1]
MTDAFEIEICKDKPNDPIGRFLWAWSKLSAFGGVVILVGICLLSTASVIGRSVFNTPIKGDVELVQIGCALAIAAFLPYAQMKKAHVIVDFFTLKAPAVIKQFLDIFASILLGLVALVLMWRSYFGAVSAFKYGTKTMILGLPEWLAHVTIAPGFFLLALTAFYTAWRFFKQYDIK